MARACLCLILLAGCGLASKDVEVSQDFQAGGGPPTAGTSFDSSKLLAPISADVSKLSSVTLSAARLEATDGGDLSFVSGASLHVSANVLPDRLLANVERIAALTAELDRHAALVETDDERAALRSVVEDIRRLIDAVRQQASLQG